MLAAFAAILGQLAAAPAPTEPSLTAQATCSLNIVEHAKVAEVIDGDTVRLADGRQVRLVGIQAPKLSLGRRNFSDWPLANEAKAALEKLTLGQRVALAFGGLKADRNGRTLAHLYRDGSNEWLQGAMMSAGFARVYTWADNRSCVPELMARERAARAAKAGIWALPFYRIRKATELDGEVDTFQLVEGQVMSAALVRGRVFLNFGRDYTTDFTATVAPESVKFFIYDPRTLTGKTIRVRGWLALLNGPEIEITHPEQIELLP